MNRKLFVGNLPYSVTEQDIQEAFGQVGTVDQVRIIRDQETQRPRGFAFVDMRTDADAEAAIQRFDDAEFGGRRLVVNVAKAKTEHRGGRPQGQGHGPARRRDNGRREARW